MICYFNFKKLNDQYLITNDLGRYMFLSKAELQSLLLDQTDTTSEFGQAAAENFFYYDGSIQAFSEQLKPYMRDSKSYLFSATSLHIFVVTNRCNMNCVYCQARTDSTVPAGMMTEDVAKRAVDIALSAPSKYLTFEFQGGEPLLNFPVIKYIVEYAASKQQDKIIEYNIVSNLTVLTDEMIDFIKVHQIGISTSLDGDASLHNKNRTYSTGAGTFVDVQCGIQRLKASGIRVGAIETTTRNSLGAAKQIIDTYHAMDMPSIFLRPLTPLGRARERWREIGYTPTEFVSFYRECFRYLMELNASGVQIREGHASIVLAKILTGQAVNYILPTATPIVPMLPTVTLTALMPLIVTQYILPHPHIPLLPHLRLSLQLHPPLHQCLPPQLHPPLHQCLPPQLHLPLQPHPQCRFLKLSFRVLVAHLSVQVRLLLVQPLRIIKRRKNVNKDAFKGQIEELVHSSVKKPNERCVKELEPSARLV